MPLTIVALDDLTLRSDEPGDPKALLMLGEIAQDRMQSNRPVIVEMLTEMMLFGSAAILIDEDGNARCAPIRPSRVFLGPSMDQVRTK